MIRHLANIIRGVSKYSYLIATKIVFVVLLLVDISCGRAELLEDIIEAENIAQEHPDRALAIMESIDPGQLTSAKLRGHYALSYIMTQYYNELIPQSDSLSRDAVEYFAKSQDHYRRARAYFHNGCGYQQSGLGVQYCPQQLGAAPRRRIQHHQKIKIIIK